MNIKLFITSVILIVFMISGNLTELNAQSKSMDAWESLLNKKELAEYFSGLFDHLGIHVIETGEEFTVHHKGDHFTLSEGIKKDETDFVADIRIENVKNMQKHGADAKIDALESYKIISVLFTPMTRSTMAHPILMKPLAKKVAGLESLLHIYLLSPDEKEINSHTLVFVNKQWLVIEGIHGTAERTYRLKPDAAVLYQKKIFAAIKKDSVKGWKEFKKWYVEWRKGVSETP